MDETPDWAEAATEFLSENMPTATDRDGWNHMSSTAYEIGCMALVALGQADERDWGAVPRKNPIKPKVLPRWDDICIAVLRLANQQNQLAFRLQDGSVPPTRIGNNFTIVQKGAPPPPAPNVAESCGLGPAFAKPKVIYALERLNLVSGGHWTEVAEFVLWRTQPKNWALDFTNDPRFISSVERTAETMPDDIILEIENLLSVTNEQIANHIEWHRVEIEKMRTKYGPKAHLQTPPTADQAKRSIEFSRKNEMDWLFFRRWRMEEGWLSRKQAKAALKIFHDRLAISMRKSVIKKLHPTQVHFFE